MDKIWVCFGDGECSTLAFIPEDGEVYYVRVSSYSNDDFENGTTGYGLVLDQALEMDQI